LVAAKHLNAAADASDATRLSAADDIVSAFKEATRLRSLGQRVEII
jgi:hypothetical protein